MTTTTMTQFGAQSTTDDVLDGVDLTGQRILVTGVSAGLGVETARTLVAHGASVVGAAATSINTDALDVAPVASVTETVNGAESGSRASPLMAPLALIESPEGSAPEASANV